MIENPLGGESVDAGEVASCLCASCGAEMGAAKFCPECGTAVEPPHPTCAACGHRLDDAPKFCPECGAQLPVEG
ncbi:MAG TPA: hypothetical protein VF666_15135 [Pyrinomonadaceae bacterium]